ncbi:uncharacterized protein LOC144634818 [Oculina patagonica]
MDDGFRCHQEWPALGLSWRADNQGRMVENTLTKGQPKCPLKKAFRKTLVCIPGAKRFRCKRGTALSFVDIKLSRSPAPGHRCRHHARNEDNSTLPNDHRCNVTKVIAKVRKRCQGRQECWISLNERHLGSACVKEVKFLQVNFTCEQRGNMTEESGLEEYAMYRRWYDMDHFCTNDDDEDINDEYDDGDDVVSGDGSDIGSDGDDNDEDGGDYNNDDYDDNNDDDDVLDENDDNTDTFEDDVARFQPMAFLGDSHLFSAMRHLGRGRQQCPRLNWFKQPDLYKEFTFNPPSVCPRNRPMQSNCNPNLCKLVKCGDDKNFSCRVNPCGTCTPECYDVSGNRVQSPRALTKCEYKRLEMRHRHFDDINAVPRCNEDGSFVEIQCLPELNICWCVDEHGNERNGTRQEGKPTNCKALVPVLSPCQSSQLNVKNLKEHLSKKIAEYNETANNLKTKAENATQWLQQQPIQQLNQSRRHHQQYITHQMGRATMCRMVARFTRIMEKYVTKPKCAADGSYESIQCESSGKRCWCVDENGNMVGYGVKSLKKLNCSSAVIGRANVCPSVMSYGAGGAQNRPRPCRNDRDCSDSKVCCQTNLRGRRCVDPPPKMPDVKPGKCPVVPKSVNYTCTSKCKTDADCSGDMKCCAIGCGKRCIPANKPVCPKDKPFKLCIYDKCLSSPGCPSHPSACCRMNYCGECTAEYFDGRGHKIDCSNATQCQKQRHAATETYKGKFLQVYGTMPLHVPGTLGERNVAGQDGGHGGNQGGRQGDHQGGRQGNGNGGGRGGRSGKSADSGGHDDDEGGGSGDYQQGGNGGNQGGMGHWSGQRRGGNRGRGRQNGGQRSQVPDLGVFIPECNQENGAFLSEQCNVTAGVCWCVDEKGREKPNTRAQVQRGTRDCSAANTKGNEHSKGVHRGKKEDHQKTKSVARMNIRLMGNFDDVIGKKEQFINNFKDEVVSISKVKKEQIQNVEISRGSIKVQFEIVEAGDSAPLEEIVERLETEVKSKNFVVRIAYKEYRSDGDFHAVVHNRHYDDTADANTSKRHLTPVEAIAIGSCGAVCLLGTAVLFWKFYFRGKKEAPEGWKDVVKEKPLEVQYTIPDPGPTLTSSATPPGHPPLPGVKAVEAVPAMPEPSV